MALGPRFDRARVEVPSAPERGPAGFDPRLSRALSQIVQRLPQTGRAVLSFGAFPGAADAQVQITGQADIPADAIVRAELALVATPDHSADEHLVEPIVVRAGNIVPRVGFTLFGIYSGPGEALASGQWTVAWSWS